MPARYGTAVSATPLSATELGGWLRLQMTPGVGRVAAHRLLGAFGLPERIFEADLASLLKVVPARLAHGLRAPPDANLLRLLALTLAWQDQPGHAVLTLGDPAYPPLLLEIADPPLLLYVVGRADLLAHPALAIVGSRTATQQGLAHARRFAEALSAAGLCIVSGLALGIDGAAHAGALGAGGATVAVIGTGCDRLYPARHRALAEQIAARGCMVSEYALGTPALAANFPRRNRLIAGLARGVLVVEAAAQSGSLITARLAAEQGREVFAIPGSIHAPLSRGCHQLLREGAKLVESVHDILEELGPAFAAPAPAAPSTLPPSTSPPAASADDALLALIAHEPVDLDTLAAHSGLAIAPLSAALLALELDGRVERLAGGRYRRLES